MASDCTNLSLMVLFSYLRVSSCMRKLLFESLYFRSSSYKRDSCCSTKLLAWDCRLFYRFKSYSDLSTTRVSAVWCSDFSLSISCLCSFFKSKSWFRSSAIDFYIFLKSWSNYHLDIRTCFCSSATSLSFIVSLSSA